MLHKNRHYLHTRHDFSPAFLHQYVFWIISNVASQMMRAVCLRKVRQLLSKCQNSSLKFNIFIPSSPFSLHTHCICLKSCNVALLMNAPFLAATAFRFSFHIIHLVTNVTKVKLPNYTLGPRSYVESVARSAVVGGDQPTSTWSPCPPEETTGPQRSTSPTPYSLNPPLSSSSPIQSSQRWVPHKTPSLTPDKTEESGQYRKLHLLDFLTYNMIQTTTAEL